MEQLLRLIDGKDECRGLACFEPSLVCVAVFALARSCSSEATSALASMALRMSARVRPRLASLSAASTGDQTRLAAERGPLRPDHRQGEKVLALAGEPRQKAGPQKG